MASRIGRFALRRPVIVALLTIALVAGAVWTGYQVHGAIQLHRFESRLASLEAEHAPGPHALRSWTITFRGRPATITTTVDLAEAARTRDLDTVWVFGTRGDLRERFIRRMVQTQVRSDAVDALATQTRILRDELRLDSDGYVELLARVVQEVPFGDAQPDTARVRFSAEVIADGSGVCSEKALLLAALLVHEGYDACVWALDGHRHAAAGIAADGSGFRGSGYAYIETTRLAYVGQVSTSYLDERPWHRPPQLVTFGGTARYGAGDEIAFILARLRDARETARESQPFTGYVRAANRWAAGYDELSDNYVRAARTVGFIEANTDDRPRVYEVLRTPAAFRADAGT